jgi:hypothetical protein
MIYYIFEINIIKFFMQIILLFLLSFIQIIECASDQPMIGYLQIDNVPIPAYVCDKKTYSGKTRDCAIIKSAQFHKNYIIPRQSFFDITHAPLICYKSKETSECIVPLNDSPIQTILIKKQDEKFKNFIINHEMVHLYLGYKYEKSSLNFEEYFQYCFKLSCISSAAFFLYAKIYPILLDYKPHYKLSLGLIRLLLLEYSVIHALACGFNLFLSHRKQYYYRIEEFFCDAKGITYGSKEEQLKAIKAGTTFLKVPEQLSLKIKLSLFLFGRSHPLQESRIEQLKKIKRLISTDNREDLNTYVNNQEQILKSYYESFLTNPKNWLSIRWVGLKTRLSQTKQLIKSLIDFLKNKDEFIQTPYDEMY